jgi:hypothetical protein
MQKQIIVLIILVGLTLADNNKLCKDNASVGMAPCKAKNFNPTTYYSI